ncbi:membrane protein, partial [Avibacterium paragallinarum]
MTINVDFWHLVGLLLSFLGCCFGFAKILVAQFQSSLSERHQNQLKVNDKVEELEK